MEFGQAVSEKFNNKQCDRKLLYIRYTNIFTMERFKNAIRFFFFFFYGIFTSNTLDYFGFEIKKSIQLNPQQRGYNDT
jgi:hypothetical protein